MIPTAQITSVQYAYQDHLAEIELLWADSAAFAPNGLVIIVRRNNCICHRMRTSANYRTTEEAVLEGESLVRLYISVSSFRPG